MALNRTQQKALQDRLLRELQIESDRKRAEVQEEYKATVEALMDDSPETRAFRATTARINRFAARQLKGFTDTFELNPKTAMFACLRNYTTTGNPYWKWGDSLESLVKVIPENLFYVSPETHAARDAASKRFSDRVEAITKAANAARYAITDEVMFAIIMGNDANSDIVNAAFARIKEAFANV